MPTITTIPQLFDMAPDLPVLCVKAKIKQVYKVRESKPDSAKKWKFQDIYGTDGKNDIKITLCDHEDFPKSEVGKWYYFSCKQSDKHGWTGVKTKDDDYEGKITRVLWCTKTALIEPEDGYEASQASGGAPKAPPTQRTQPSPKPATPNQPKSGVPKAPGPRGEEAKQAIIDVKRFLGARANLMVLCLEAAMFAAHEFYKRHPGQELSAEQYQAITSSLFISGERAGAAGGLPYDLMEKYLPFAQQAPAGAAPPTVAPPPPPPPEPEPEPEPEPDYNDDVPF